MIKAEQWISGITYDWKCRTFFFETENKEEEERKIKTKKKVEKLKKNDQH